MIDARVSDFFVTMIQGADTILKEEHAWLLAHEECIVRLIDGKFVGTARDRRKAAQRVCDHLMRWGAEMTWFVHPEAGRIKFVEICSFIGQDSERALEIRREFFRLPFPPRLAYFAMRRLGARIRRRKETRSRG